MSSILEVKAAALYQAGFSTSVICEKLEIYPIKLYKLLRAAGVQLRRDHPAHVVEKIKRDYGAGASTVGIAAELGLGRDTVARVLRSNGIRVKPPSEWNRRSVNHDAFKVLNEDSAYWIGFLLADGCVTGSNLNVGLQQKDRRHLEKLAKFLHSEYKISDFVRVVKGKEHNCSATTIISKSIVADLSTFGITSRKSGTETAPDLLVSDQHFWRGVIDGDGSVLPRSGASRYPRIRICGSHQLCSQFLKFAEMISEGSRKPSQVGSIWETAVKGRGARDLAHHLYGNNPTYFLDRKMAKAQEILNA